MVAVVQLPEPSRTFYPGPSGSGQGDIGESHGCGRHSQLCHVLGDTLGQDTQALVAASHHRVHTGALCWAAWAQPAAVLIVACRREPRRHVRAVQSGSPSGYRKSFCSHSEGLRRASTRCSSCWQGRYSPGLGNGAAYIPRMAEQSEIGRT